MKQYKYTINGAQYDVTIDSIVGSKAKVEVNGIPFEVEMQGSSLVEEALPTVTTDGAAPAAAPAAPAATEAPAAPAETEAPAAPAGVAKVALVTDVGTIDDESFNQACWQGVEAWCTRNNVEYTYYQPTEDSTDARVQSVAQAIAEGADTIVMPGYLFGETVLTVQDEMPDVYFIAVDVGAGDLTFDYSTYYEPSANVACLTFSEEQAGYLAGYAAVKEGYTKLGFTGGGGGTNPACCRYGYGFVQGADAAAKELNEKVEMNYSWQYGATFSASPELQTMANGWYTNGTECIFACGGSMFASVAAAAAANDGKVVGVDVDQSFESDTVITSAMKGLAASVQWACAKVYDGSFAAMGGTCATLGSGHTRRGLLVFACGMVCTAVTLGMYLLGFSGQEIIIYFGVLHCLGVCMLLWGGFRKLPTWALGVLGAALTAAGLWLRTRYVSFPWLIVLGFAPDWFASSDYFPLFPNLGYFLLGAVLGRALYAEKKSLLPRENPPAKALQWMGRKSLLIYLLHQPILAAAVGAIAMIKG